MTRPLLLSNDHMHVGINLYGMVHDFYYPWVGFENHARAGNMRHRIGIWCDDTFSWLDDGNWTFTMRYHDRTQIGHTTVHSKKLGITIEFTDCVADDYNVFLRSIHLINATGQKRQVRLFLHQVFLIGASLNGDTAQFLPDEPAIMHYKGRRTFIVGAKDQSGEPFTQHSIGFFGSDNHEGTFKDAEDGWLTANYVDFGKVDSVIGFSADIAPYESTRYEYWIAAGKSQWQALDLHRKVRKEGAHEFFAHTARHWHRWLGPAEKFIHTLNPELKAPFRNSLLVLKSQIDHKGAVIASTDTTRLNYRKDSYAYSWPRDASYALWPLLRMGYKNELKNYFAFCRDVMHPDGYLLQKYRPDGAVGSSWLPYVVSGRVIPPIQEDETAIVVFLLGEYVERTKDKETLKEFYDSLVKPAANFMCGYINPATKLPQPSYDLWEEKFLTTTYTTATVHAALQAAVRMAERLRKQPDAVRWQTTADEIRDASSIFFNQKQSYFYKGFIEGEDSQLTFDETIDISSFYGAFMFDLFSNDSDEIKKAHKTLEKTFGLTEHKPTIIQRYTLDQYYTTDPKGMGNPWFITTLWMAQYDLLAGNTARAQTTINWVKDHMLSTGVLSEQMHPKTYTFESVAPLTWSQAEFLSSVLDLQAKLDKQV